MKYLNEFQDHSNYAAFIVGSKFASIQTEKRDTVSYCINQNEVHFNPYVPPKAKLLDILYSDTNGNLSFTSEVLPASEGKTPIGLCIAGTGFFGTNEKARWMSLKYMDYTTPDIGTLTPYAMYWGSNNIDIPTISNIKNTYNGGSVSGALTANWITNTYDKIPSLFDSNNNWNLSVLGTVNTYMVTDIDGKNKTNKILEYATGQSTWQTDTSIEDSFNSNYFPTVCCCWRYHTLGTNQGDWYLGSGGEMSMIVVKRNEINTKLSAINTIYPNNCINSLIINTTGCWTSTEFSDSASYKINLEYGQVGISGKGTINYVISLLQY